MSVSSSDGNEPHPSRYILVPKAMQLIPKSFTGNPVELREFILNLEAPYEVAEPLTFSRLMTYIYICHTAPLTSRCCIFFIYSTNIHTEYFKHAAHSPFFPLQNAIYFIMLTFLVHVLFTF